MSKNLLIVESPAKAKTIEKYLGEKFQVKSSFGHIRDLAKGDKGVDIENDFKPSYAVSPEKTKVVKDLKDAAKRATEVWLATDEDREGEAISWHLCEVLGLDENVTKRIVFREITKPAILKAVENPRLVDKNLVDAQQARRILDRLVGFELSGTLWRKIRGKLSAGRVQSVAVKLIVERERDIQGFEATPFFKVSAFFQVKNTAGQMVSLKAELSDKYDSKEDAQAFLEKCKGSDYTIKDIVKKPSKRNPAAPFITSTLQQEASRKLYFSVKRTMQIAQKLYEQGHITYMRTDSTSLSATSVAAISEAITSEYGERYLHVRKFKSKSSNAQEAHEAIRPTYVDRREVSGDRDQQRLYDLIWKRTVASQMAQAEIEKTTAQISISNVPDANLSAKGEVLTFDGFLKLYMESTDEDDDKESHGMLPPLTIGQQLDLSEIVSTERYTRPPSRYTEAALVKKLEELGIGRPSTYAPTISKIMEKERGYVVKESREGKERKYRILTLKDEVITEVETSEITGSTSNRLYATDMGMVVTDFLNQHFEDVMDYSFTAGVENKLDKIAGGKENWVETLKAFYFPFHESVEETIEKAERAKGTRELGTDPESGNTVLVQMTRYGPAAQIGTVEEVGEEGKPRFASLRPGQSMETITYEEVMDLFKLPRTLGEYKTWEITVNNGRYGPYVKYGEKYATIPKGEDPLSMSLERAKEIVDAKELEDAPVGTYQGVPITKGKGRFGPYLKWNKFFINVSKKYDFDNLTKEEMDELVAAKIEKEANRYIQRWEKEQIAIENGRWGPFFRVKKKSIKIPKIDGEKMEAEKLKELSLEQVIEMINEVAPGTIKVKKKKAPAKKKDK